MDDGNVAVLAILDNQTSSYKTDNNMTLTYHDHVSNPTHSMPQEEVDASENHKQNVIWSKNSTLTLLNLYENKMHMMDNPKKKTKMWSSIADELKSFNIEVTPDQVRWKVNALTKKYKDCVEKCQGPATFKYFNEMHHILGRYNDDNSAYRLASGVIQGHSEGVTEQNTTVKNFLQKSSTPFRRLRTERKAKIEIDKQWLEYLRRQEEQKQLRNERYERSLRLREEELQLRRKEIEMKQSIALKKLQLRERKQEEFLRIEREKCDLLRQIMSTNNGKDFSECK